MPIERCAEASPDRSIQPNSLTVRFLDIEFDPQTLDQFVATLAAADATAPFRYVVTPNVDHVVQLTSESWGAAKAWDAFRGAAWRVCDSRILSALARLRGVRLPVSPGSDLTVRLFAGVIERGDNIAVVGGTGEALERLRTRYPGVRFTQHIAPMGLLHDQAAMDAAAEFVIGARARFTFFAVGSPQQELLAAQIARRGGAVGIGLCVGAAINFLVGLSPRAPVLARTLGLEWAHRLLSDPRRLWRRYLIDGPRIFWIAARWRR